MILEVAAKKINVKTDTGATYSVLISHVGPLSSKGCAVTDVIRQLRTHYFTGPLTCQFKLHLISHSFLVVPESLTPVVGKDLPGSLRAILGLQGPKQPLFLTLRQITWKNNGLFSDIFYTHLTGQFGTKESLKRL